jgi:hypothetical protein
MPKDVPQEIAMEVIDFFSETTLTWPSVRESVLETNVLAICLQGQRDRTPRQKLSAAPKQRPCLLVVGNAVVATGFARVMHNASHVVAVIRAIRRP